MKVMPWILGMKVLKKLSLGIIENALALLKMLMNVANRIKTLESVVADANDKCNKRSLRMCNIKKLNNERKKAMSYSLVIFCCDENMY